MEIETETTMPPKNNPETWSEEEQAFEQARRAYPNSVGKRGHPTEWKNFRAKHKDWREIVFALYPAIKLIEKRNEMLRRKKEFVPPWPYFQTWINQRRWEEAAPE
jgi:hypothetical protein